VGHASSQLKNRAAKFGFYLPLHPPESTRPHPALLAFRSSSHKYPHKTTSIRIIAGMMTTNSQTFSSLWVG